MWEGHFCQGTACTEAQSWGTACVPGTAKAHVMGSGQLGEAVEQGYGAGATRGTKAVSCFLRFPPSLPPAASFPPSAPRPGHRRPARTEAATSQPACQPPGLTGDS